MARRIALVVTALATAWIYWYVFIAAVGYAAALPIPTRWLSIFPTRQSAVLTWMVTWHTLAVLIVSVPFGLLIQRVYGRRGIIVAFLVTLAMFAFEIPYLGELFRGKPPRLQLVALFDQLKLIGMLPLSVWLFARLPSNNRWRGP